VQERVSLDLHQITAPPVRTGSVTGLERRIVGVNLWPAVAVELNEQADGFR